MTMIRSTVLLTLGLVLGARSTAMASPSSGLQQGAGAFLDAFSFSLRGDHALAGSCLDKPSDSLDLAVAARSFGLSSDLIVHLHGSREGDRITWTFDEPLGGIEVGLLDYADRIHGRLVAVARSTGSVAERACMGGVRPYDVSFAEAGGSEIHLEGHNLTNGWTEDATDIRFSGVAGLGPNPLAEGAIDVQRVCERTRPRMLTGHVTLDHAASADGELVSIASSVPQYVSAPTVMVPGGSREQTFTVLVTPGWHGEVTLEASAGGQAIKQRLEVLPLESCQYDLQGRTYSITTVPSCSNCTFTGLGVRGDLLASSPDGPLVFRPGYGLVSVNKALPGLSVSTINGINAAGVVTGSATSNDGERVSFVAAPFDPSRAPTFYDPQEVPLALNAHGVIVGSHISDGRSIGVVFNDKGTVSLPIGPGDSSATVINDLDAIAGEIYDGSGVGAFVLRYGKLQTLAGLGGSSLQVTGLGNGGDLVGYAQRKDQSWRAFSADPDGKQLIDLGVLKGYSQSWATGVNGDGEVVGCVSAPADGKNRASRGFIYSASTGILDLNALLEPGMDAFVEEAIAINDRGEILARGTYKDQSTYFVLAPKH